MIRVRSLLSFGLLATLVACGGGGSPEEPMAHIPQPPSCTSSAPACR